MKLDRNNKRLAGIKPSNDVSKPEHYYDSHRLPPELEEYISKLPSSMVNNSRSIVRKDFHRILRLNPMTAAKILADKYDIHLDPDRTARDYGGPPEREMSEAERRFWDTMPPQDE